MIIYKTTNLINGKFYVGKDASNNPNYYGSGLLLAKAIKKYGKENFKKEILEECQSLKYLNIREKYWIASLDATNKKIGYNITIGGIGGDTYSNQSESRKKEINDTRNSSSYAYRQTDEYKQKRRDIAKQLWQRIDVRDKIKKKLVGREINWKDKIGVANKKIWETRGDIRSEETKQIVAEKNRKKMKGYEFVKIPETIQNEIIKLYQSYGPKLIANKITETGYPISKYIVTRFLKKSGLYKKWQKGIGDKEQKNSSISRRGKLNPMWKN